MVMDFCKTQIVKDKLMISKKICGEILEVIILHRERDDINQGDFHHLVRSVMQVSSPEDQHDLIKKSMDMIHMDLTVPPEDRPPGAPGSRPKKRDVSVEEMSIEIESIKN